MLSRRPLSRRSILLALAWLVCGAVVMVWWWVIAWGDGPPPALVVLTVCLIVMAPVVAVSLLIDLVGCFAHFLTISPHEPDEPVVVRQRERRCPKFGPGRCGGCGYPREGLAGDLCPECGREVVSDREGWALIVEDWRGVERGASVLLWASAPVCVLLLATWAFGDTGGLPLVGALGVQTVAIGILWDARDLLRRVEDLDRTPARAGLEMLLVSLAWGGWFFLAMVLLGQLEVDYTPVYWGCFGGTP